jgi:hypothetical protein
MDIFPGRADPDTPPRRSFWRGVRSTFGAPFRAFPSKPILDNARLIRELAQGPRPPHGRERRVFRDDDGQIDMLATSFSMGMPEWQLEARVAQRCRETKRMAYAAFALGWVFLGLWFHRALFADYHRSRLLAALQFLPFCAVFFLLAFKAAYQNWQLRTRTMGTAGDYLRSRASFWPS